MAKKNQAGSEQSGDGGETVSKPRKPKGPELTWNEQRDYALALAVAGGTHNTAELATQLASNEAFAGVPAGVITSGKVRLRLATLRKKGAAIPTFGRGRGYVPDIAAINGLFGASGSGEQPAQ